MTNNDYKLITIAQINPKVGDIRQNLDIISESYRIAAESGAYMVITPELALCGYPPEDLVYNEHFIDENMNCLDIIREQTGDTYLILGHIDRCGENIFNAATVIRNKDIIGTAHKIKLPNYGVFDEKRYFTEGTRPLVLDLEGITAGINICEDIWTDDIVAWQKKKGAEIIFNLSASPFDTGKKQTRSYMLRKRAKKYSVSIFYVNMVGGQDELVFDGGSMVIPPNEKMEITADNFREHMLTVNLYNNGDIKPAGLYTYDKNLSPAEEIYEALKLGIKDYILKNGFQKVIIGLSGGIDSAVTAVLAADALGSSNIAGISMPSIYTSEATRTDASGLASSLGITFFEIPITPIFDTFIDSTETLFNGTRPDETEQNIQARIRGNILMAYSNKFGHLLLTTGNKSEISCGYCTLYGDTAGGFAPLKDVSKTTVYKLANFINIGAGYSLIPDTIIKRPPTAELDFNQKDTDSLPEYAILDKILEEYVQKNKNAEEIAESTGCDVQLAKKIINMIHKNEFKRRQSPPGIRITPLAFGRDRRMPITNGFREH